MNSYLKCIVYDELLKPRQLFLITLYFKPIFLYNTYSYMFRHYYIIIREFYTPDHHPNNIDRGLYMQPQIHTACTRDSNVEQNLLYH